MKTLSVSEIINAIKSQLEGEFQAITVEGEVSNLSGSAAGHYYFTLSDKSASISCALFKMDALRNPIIRKCKNGDKIIVSGPISVYSRRGTFQLIAKRISPVGQGDLKAQFEELKRKLTSEGLFDLDIKKPIPPLPKRIAVITALGGAALQDFLNIIRRRSSWYDISIIPAVVQGDKCPSSVISAINTAERKGDFDVIVITRGGGSLEDLWGFNSEALVRKAFECRIPIVSAVGHQVDFSLLDFVSDLRCETPSSAAEILTTEQVRLSERLRQNAKHLRSLAIEFKGEIERKTEKFNPINMIPMLLNSIKDQRERLENVNLSKKVDPVGVYGHFQSLDNSLERIKERSLFYTLDKEHRLLRAKAVLDSLNPKGVLKRGYTMLEEDSGKMLTSYAEFVKIDETKSLKITFSDGSGKVKKIGV